MPSVKGRASRYKRFKHRQRVMAALDARLVENTEQSPPPVPVHTLHNPIAGMRQAYLFECLHELRMQGFKGSQFGIVWHPNIKWATGPTIKPYEHIFDRYVEGHWSVTVVDNIQDSGKSGWLFTKIA